MSNLQRTFIPGSEWIYLKIYSGEKTADDLLIRVIIPIMKKLKKEQYLKKWFFVRYSDPDFHLRLRLLLNDTQYFGKVIYFFYEKLKKWNNDSLIWKVQLDTYNRELERYNKNLIEETESIFYADSECILSIIRKLNGNENYRWMIALKLVDELLTNFCLTIEEKQKTMKNLSNSFKTEFGFNKYYLKQFNLKFRENKKNITDILNNNSNEKEKTLISLFRPIKKRTKKLMSIIEQINAKSEKDHKVKDLLKSYLHMTMNRLFRSKNRLHELVLYDFMFRYYTSEIAKKRYN